MISNTTYINIADDAAAMQPDDWKINMDDAWQVLWWCRFLGLTKTQLEIAIKAVGTVVVDIKAYLATQPIAQPKTPPSQAPSGASHITSRSTINRSPF